jgi:hypothetical protein
LNADEELTPDDVCETDAIDAWDMVVADVVAYVAGIVAYLD